MLSVGQDALTPGQKALGQTKPVSVLQHLGFSLEATLLHIPPVSRQNHFEDAPFSYSKMFISFVSMGIRNKFEFEFPAFGRVCSYCALSPQLTWLSLNHNPWRAVSLPMDSGIDTSYMHTTETIKTVKIEFEFSFPALGPVCSLQRTWPTWFACKFNSLSAVSFQIESGIDTSYIRCQHSINGNH